MKFKNKQISACCRFETRKATANIHRSVTSHGIYIQSKPNGIICRNCNKNCQIVLKTTKHPEKTKGGITRTAFITH